MKYLFIILFFVCSCNFTKVSNVRISNKNPYAIDVTVIANDVKYTVLNIAANSKNNGTLDFTKIAQTDGEYILVIKHLNDGSVDSFTHGYFTNGQLANYTDLEVIGHEAKIEISE